MNLDGGGGGGGGGGGAGGAGGGDGGDGEAVVSISTGLTPLNKLLTALFTSSNISCTITAVGDLWIDDHHLIEDCGIAVGQCLAMCLGDKRGCVRMNSEGRAVVDLSGRPWFGMDEMDGDIVVNGDDASSDDANNVMSGEMFHHLLDSIVIVSKATVHILPSDGNGSGKGSGKRSSYEIALETITDFGICLRKCVGIDRRREGKVASSKGTLSA
jgi:imidazoleglycerol-phosphate dehydratase